MKSLAIACILILSMSCTWNKQDSLLLGTYGALSTIDAIQTLNFDDDTIELMPLLRDENKRPVASKVIGYKIAGFIGLYFVADYFEEYRTTILIVPTVIQGGVVLWNLQF